MDHEPPDYPSDNESDMSVDSCPGSPSQNSMIPMMDKNQRASLQADTETSTHAASPTDLSSPQKTEERMQNSVQEAEKEGEKTIMVTGNSLDLNDKEMCQYYFENEKRSGGGEVSNVQWDGERKHFLVTFADRTVAQRVASRDHFLKKDQLQVQLYQSPLPPRDRGAQPSSKSKEHSPLPTVVYHKDRFAVFGVPARTSSDYLQNYLEFAADVSVESLNEEGDHWCVVLDSSNEEIDILQMNRACKENPFSENIQLQIKEIPLHKENPLQNTILVVGLKDSSVDEAIQLFFSNKRRNHGGPVERVERLSDTSTALVHFKNHEDAENVVKKGDYTLDGNQLHVTLYRGTDSEEKHESAKPSREEHPHPRHAPPDGQVEMKFEEKTISKIFESQELLKILVTDLKSVNAKVRLKAPGLIIVNCLLDVPTEDWEINVQKKMKSILKYLSSLKPSEEAEHARQARDVMEPLPKNKNGKARCSAELLPQNETGLSGLKSNSQMSKMADPPSSPVSHSTKEKKHSPPSMTMSAMGQNENLWKHNEVPKCETSDVAKSCLAHSADEAIPIPNCIAENTINLKPWQQRVLNDQAVLEKLYKDCQGLEISVNEETKTATIRAPKDMITKAVSKVLAFILALRERSIPLTPAKVKMYEQEDTFKWIKKNVIDKHDLLCHWQVCDDHIILTGQGADLINLEKLIMEVFKEVKVKIEESQLCLLKSHTWLSFLDELQRNDESPSPVLLLEDDHVVIVDTPSCVSRTQLKLKKFLEKSKLEEETLNINQNQVKLMKEYCGDTLNNLVKKAKENGVTITFIRPGMVAKGPKDCLSGFVKEVKELLGKILEDKMTFKKPGTAKYLRGPKGQEFLVQVGKTTHCVVTTEGRGIDHGTSSVQLGGGNIIANVQLDPDHQLQIVQGDITKCPVDAIVNAANNRLSHDGGVAAAIVKAGGKSIQQESEKVIKKQGLLKTGETAVTKAGNLPCSHVIHAVGPIWSGTGKYRDSSSLENNEERLAETVRNVLKTAQEMKLTSIALPAISCGIFHFPVGLATKSILFTVDKFLRDKQHEGSLKTVVLIDMNADPVNGFLQAAKALYGKQVQVKNSPKSAKGSQINTQQQEAQTGSFRDFRHSHSDHGYGEKSHMPLNIIPGEIAKARADVIVCTTHPSLDLEKGVLSKSILREGGALIQQELMNFSQRNDVPRPGHVVRTSGGNLHCKNVFHLSLPRWRDDHGQTMRSAVLECLQEASKKRAKSIAFPTLGTGRLGYPSDQVAAIMSSAISQWFDNHRDSSLKEVQVIVFPKDTESLQAFRAGESQSRGKTGSRASHQFSSRKDNSDFSGGFKKCKVTIGKITVMVKEGDILSEPCDAIVNSSNDNLDLSKGVLSKAISKAGGSQLQSECVKQKSQMMETGVAVTKTEGLNSGTVIHVSADRFKREWQKGIAEVLHAADSEDISSLAIPALGTGGRGADPEELAQAMRRAVIQFSRHARTLKEVHVVVFQKQLMDPYISAFDPSTSSHRAEKSGSGAEASTHSEKKSLSEVDVFICSFEHSFIKHAREKIHKHVTDMVVSRTETNPLISCFTSEQKENMFRLQNKFDVEITLDAKKNAVTFTGVETDVLSAVSGLKDIMISASDERHKAAGGPPVRWQYETGNEKFADFDPDSNVIIEAAFKTKEPHVTITDKRERQYRIVFSERKEYRLNDPRAKPVAVKRRDILQEKSQEIPLPPHWAPMKGDKVKLVSLKPDSPEYKRVAEHFGKQGNIKTIERIQNPTLFQQFKVKKRELEQYNPKGTENEKRLFHGTSADSITGIITNGFNRSYCGKNGTALGAGVYFAANSSTSMGYTQGGGKMFQARVLVGEYTTGNSSMRTPPMKPSSDRPYDSVGNGSSNASVFVIFHDCQAYPEYLITLQ